MINIKRKYVVASILIIIIVILSTVIYDFVVHSDKLVLKRFRKFISKTDISPLLEYDNKLRGRWVKLIKNNHQILWSFNKTNNKKPILTIIGIDSSFSKIYNFPYYPFTKHEHAEISYVDSTFFSFKIISRNSYNEDFNGAIVEVYDKNIKDYKIPKDNINIDPIEEFGSIIKLKNNLDDEVNSGQIININLYHWVGNFSEFNLNEHLKVYFIPDTLKFNKLADDSTKIFWNNRFKACTKINNNWCHIITEN